MSIIKVNVNNFEQYNYNKLCGNFKPYLNPTSPHNPPCMVIACNWRVFACFSMHWRVSSVHWRASACALACIGVCLACIDVHWHVPGVHCRVSSMPWRALTCLPGYRGKGGLFDLSNEHGEHFSDIPIQPCMLQLHETCHHCYANQNLWRYIENLRELNN